MTHFGVVFTYISNQDRRQLISGICFIEKVGYFPKWSKNVAVESAEMENKICLQVRYLLYFW